MDYSIIFSRLISPVVSFVLHVLGVAGIIFLALVVYTAMKFRLRPRKLSRSKLAGLKINMRFLDFCRWKLIDGLDSDVRGEGFGEYGLTLYCGRQGSGKTISMVEYLSRIKARYPECIIVGNFDCEFIDQRMDGWRDFLEIRNGEKGVVFAIDEIHSEYSAASWKDFPEELLSEISQQRKQRVKIVASSQVFSRVVKPIREQAFTVVQCSTVMNRWTFNKEYDAKEYEIYCDGDVQKKLHTVSRYSFVQSDALRSSYDTYAKIERMQKLEFIARGERGER